MKRSHNDPPSYHGGNNGGGQRNNKARRRQQQEAAWLGNNHSRQQGWNQRGFQSGNNFHPRREHEQPRPPGGFRSDFSGPYDGPRRQEQEPSSRNRSTPIDMSAHITSFFDLPFPADPGVGVGSELSDRLMRHYLSKRQSPTTLNVKVRLWRTLTSEFRKQWPECRTHVFGSSISGFGSEASDVDMCIFPWWDGVEPQKTKNRDVQFLYGARRILRGRLRGLTQGDIEVIPAKVPIMKLVTREGGFEVDLSVQTLHGTQNTHLLYCYSQVDPRVRPLVLLAKSWAKHQGINDASQSTLSSYTLTLLVLHYLQSGVTPPVVPCLQRKAPHKFSTDRTRTGDIFGLKFENALPEFKSENEQDLGSLLSGFFQFYGNHWDFTNDVASVRTGKTLTNDECSTYAKDENISPGQWRAYIGVEEPLERTNAARAVVRREAFDDVLAAFRDAAKEVERKKGPRMEALFGEGWTGERR